MCPVEREPHLESRRQLPFDQVCEHFLIESRGFGHKPSTTLGAGNPIFAVSLHCFKPNATFAHIEVPGSERRRTSLKYLTAIGFLDDRLVHPFIVVAGIRLVSNLGPDTPFAYV